MTCTVGRAGTHRSHRRAHGTASPVQLERRPPTVDRDTPPPSRESATVRVEAILSSLPVEPYNVGIARVHARLTVAAMAKGRPRSANDMMIAATAAATSRILLTTDASAGFDQLTGVRIEVLELP
jgi:predicted nucleic acid-binding protein